jgi:hypothetical protein
MTICFPHMTNEWLHIKNWHIIYVFPPFLNHNQYCYLSIVFNTLNICSHINDFLIHWRFFQLTIVVHMPKHSKGEFFGSKYVDKKLLCFQVYGYYKVIIKVLENTNKIFILCEQYYLCITTFPHMTNIWQLPFSLQFPQFFIIIANCYLPSDFWYTKNLLIH